MDLMEITVQMGDGTLTCVGYLDTLGAEFVDADGDSVGMDFPNGCEVEVVRDGEVRMDGEARPLLPGVYRMTGHGLYKDGRPLYGPAAD